MTGRSCSGMRAGSAAKALSRNDAMRLIARVGSRLGSRSRTRQAPLWRECGSAKAKGRSEAVTAFHPNPDGLATICKYRGALWRSGNAVAISGGRLRPRPSRVPPTADVPAAQPRAGNKNSTKNLGRRDLGVRGELFSIVVSDCFDAVSERQKHACAGLHDRISRSCPAVWRAWCIWRFARRAT